MLEIFGATEVGSIASRRTVEGELWQAYRAVRLRPEAEDRRRRQRPAPAGRDDAGRPGRGRGRGRFRLLGRRADLVKLAGKRASLAGLNAILCAIDGVEDGTFFAPDDLDTSARARLSAFVVAPARSEGEIVGGLAGAGRGAFLPRPVVKVAVAAAQRCRQDRARRTRPRSTARPCSGARSVR